jgi:hypothetical protein
MVVAASHSCSVLRPDLRPSAHTELRPCVVSSGRKLEDEEMRCDALRKGMVLVGWKDRICNLTVTLFHSSHFEPQHRQTVRGIFEVKFKNKATLHLHRDVPVRARGVHTAEP